MQTSFLRQKSSARVAALRNQQAYTEVDELLDMSAEFPAGSTAATVRQAAAHAIEQHLCDHYSRRPGIVPLCRAVATLLAADGVPVGENDVVISGSVEEARYVAARAMAPGKPVFHLSALPTGMAAGLRFAGAQPTPIDLDVALPSVQGGLLIFANPDPATGQIFAPEALTRLVQWAVQSDLAVIADESVGLIRSEFSRLRFAALPDMALRTLTLGSFADASGLAAWQVSWFAGPKKVLTAVRDLKQSITICTNAPGQYAALAALDVANHEALPQYAERQEAILALLDRHQVPFWEPHTAAYVVASVAALGGATAVTATCRDAGLRIGDGNAFGAPDRIRLATPSAALGEALTRLDEALATLGKRASR